MARFWVGVSGFSYASWRGVFYPEATKSNEMLQAYANQLNSVEINSSFYHMPTRGTTTKWTKATPEKFRFSFKTNRKITHFMKLKGAKEEFDFFLEGLIPADRKLGCVLIQLPPYMKQDYETLENFLKQKPESTRIAVELRDTSWFGVKLNKILLKYNAALCVAETEDMKPVLEHTASFAYARLRHDTYSKNRLKVWSEKMKKYASGLDDCFVYFKHDETGDAAKRAVDFQAMLND